MADAPECLYHRLGLPRVQEQPKAPCIHNGVTHDWERLTAFRLGASCTRHRHLYHRLHPLPLRLLLHSANTTSNVHGELRQLKDASAPFVEGYPPSDRRRRSRGVDRTSGAAQLRRHTSIPQIEYILTNLVQRRLAAEHSLPLACLALFLTASCTSSTASWRGPAYAQRSAF